ncbi:MAG: hypothetical protein H6Q04_1901 [Acidobacteria bacterium]|jgi:hypothetical protein|nr:hypothetical protein [Acidobacteriota bacterium]
MPRRIVRLRELSDYLPLTEHQIRKLIHRQENPLPFKKAGKLILFDLEKVYRRFDELILGDDTN